MDETVLIESLFRQINEWKEKAAKWDKFEDYGYLETNPIWLKDLKTKAAKWDLVRKMQISSSGRTLETEIAVNPPIVRTDGVSAGDAYNREDEIVTNVSRKILDEYKQKAAKYDEIKSMFSL